MNRSGQLTARTPSYTEPDRNGRNILFVGYHDQVKDTVKPIFVDIDSCRKGDLVATLVTNEHRLGHTAKEIFPSIQRRLKRLSTQMDHRYINGWEKDIELFHQFELTRNAIPLILAKCEKYQTSKVNNEDYEVNDYCLDIYNELRKTWGKEPLSKDEMHNRFSQFTIARRRQIPSVPKPSLSDRIGIILGRRDRTK